jgi:conjugal transfer/entry exclusion protein
MSGVDEAAPLTIDGMFEVVQQRLAQCDALLVKLEQLDEQLRARQDLFDTDDLQVVAKRHAALSAKKGSIQAAYAEAASWYKTKITDLKELVRARAAVLAELDDRADLLSADASIMEYMASKQAHYNKSIQTIEAELTRQIRTRLQPYTDFV